MQKRSKLAYGLPSRYNVVIHFFDVGDINTTRFFLSMRVHSYAFLLLVRLGWAKCLCPESSIMCSLDTFFLCLVTDVARQTNHITFWP